MTVPDRFVGAWRRTSLVVDGVPVGAADDAEVLWLQAGEWYADLRIPSIDRGGPVEAFAGPAGWDDPRFRWVHELDWVATFPSDEGTFELVGDDLLERGTFVDGGRDVPYVERWTRSASETDFLVARSSSSGGRAVLVEIGPRRLVLIDGRAGGGEFSARRDDRQGSGWVTTFARGAEPADGVTVPDRRSLEIGASIAIGAWTLTVTELGRVGS